MSQQIAIGDLSLTPLKHRPPDELMLSVEDSGRLIEQGYLKAPQLAEWRGVSGFFDIDCRGNEMTHLHCHGAWFRLSPAQNPPQPDCIGCHYYFGQVHGDQRLVCSLHPEGYEGAGCEDSQRATDNRHF